jgi:Histone-like transcription factor (CBF/NF-Y) and archaeal histone
MPRALAVKSEVKADPEDDDYEPVKRGRGRAKKVKDEAHDDEMTHEAQYHGPDIKTKFPVARIKRIMQADEDVGKVASVTPIVVCKSNTLSLT